jgi:uncharacterized protein
MNSLFTNENDRKYLPFNLKGGVNNSDFFYLQLESFTSTVITNGLDRFKEFIIEKQKISQNAKQLTDKVKLPIQTIEEELLDLLIFGTLWNIYKGKWSGLISIQNFLLENLFHARKKFPSIKHNIDKLRGKLIFRWLDKHPNKAIEPSLGNLHRFILWLNATGDFRKESKMIFKLVKSLETYPENMRSLIFDEVFDFAEWFESRAKQSLGNYTSGVEGFIEKHHSFYTAREDYFFCMRKEVEYHLNMVGASIMNKALRKEFLQTENKIVLLPTCMAKNKNCKAVSDGISLKCLHCTTGCAISEVTTEMKSIGVDTVLIKHSSDFSKWLLPWANQNNTGLIGTACVLNLLQGGYEMKKLGIPSQCIFLDYCGCKKHWNKKGIPTNINIERALQIVEKDNSSILKKRTDKNYSFPNKFAV